MTRPCECGLGLRPRRFFGFSMEPVDGAPCFFSGSLTLGGCGLPSTDRLADCFVAGNGKIQGGVTHAVVHRRHVRTGRGASVIEQGGGIETAVACAYQRGVWIDLPYL